MPVTPPTIAKCWLKNKQRKKLSKYSNEHRVEIYIYKLTTINGTHIYHHWKRLLNYFLNERDLMGLFV